MKKYFILLLFFSFTISFSQKEDSNATKVLVKEKEVKPSIKLYKIYTLQKDTTYVDTSLTIQSEYKYNLLRKDIFGLLPFSNEGQTYNTLDFGLIKSEFSQQWVSRRNILII